MPARADTGLGAAALLVTLLAGCAGLPPEYGSDRYVVKKGDTLYSIAFRYGLDYRDLARSNGIRPPYIIYADQVIRVKGEAKGAARAAERRSTAKSKPPAGQPVVTSKPPAGQPVVTSKPPAGQPVAKSKPPAAGSRPIAPAAPVHPSGPIAGWQWPLKGKVIGAFSLSGRVNKGIDIAGRRGQMVVAAADGVVVYAGGNLRGYGKLIIIKHNDNFLSAYGNNEAMLVKEGESVKAGKSIARVGTSSSNVEMLHFEIRRDGKPEDPLKYLPKT